MAKVCNLTTEQYLLLESGTVDISVSVLHQISQAYGVELTTLMFGDEPKMSTYFITRNGKGVAVERTKAYKYQSLAAGFDVSQFPSGARIQYGIKRTSVTTDQQ